MPFRWLLHVLQVLRYSGNMTNPIFEEHERPTEALMGERVHNLLWRAKITQTAFAKSMGLSQTALSRKLRGDRAFSLDEILLVADQLRVSLDYLFGRSDDFGPDSPKVRPTD